MAELFRPGAAPEGHPPRHGRISPARPAHRAVPVQGCRSIHDLHALQACGRGKGYADAMMLDWRGQVAEATGANIFFVRDGVLHTPTPDCFLDGITRRTVIDLARRRGIEVVERAIMPEELEGFEQCFLCGTAAEVTPVSEIGPYRFEVGEITRFLMNDYANEVRPKLSVAAQ
ncbi:aminotransferase class IV [Nitratireductor aquibiodomus]|uniref:aminotransferase class IV n=1 Tax=Nitratireductor aquibiodomus TaxID=204799 RepID=UPI00351F04E6